MPNFDDATIEKLFGADDAENERSERFKEYFYYNHAYESLVSDLPVRVLVGHKGVGKSALLKRAYLSDIDRDIKCIWMRPDALLSIQTSASADNQFIKLIETWKRGILVQIINNFFGDNASQIAPELNTAKAADLVKLVIKSINTDANTIGTTSDSVVNIYIDDIDRGWSASADAIKNISALLNAIRDIGGLESRIRIRIGLRSDVYFLVRTSDESTDKIERNVIWLRWSNDQVLRVMAKRIATFFHLNTDQMK